MADLVQVSNVTAGEIAPFAGATPDPALRLNPLAGSALLRDTDTGANRTVAAAEYIALSGAAGTRALARQGTVAITDGVMADIVAAEFESVDAAFKLILVAGAGDQAVLDATVVDRGA